LYAVSSIETRGSPFRQLSVPSGMTQKIRQEANRRTCRKKLTIIFSVMFKKHENSWQLGLQTPLEELTALSGPTSSVGGLAVPSAKSPKLHPVSQPFGLRV